jgi:hypothetical protein
MFSDKAAQTERLQEVAGSDPNVGDNHARMVMAHIL